MKTQTNSPHYKEGNLIIKFKNYLNIICIFLLDTL